MRICTATTDAESLFVDTNALVYANVAGSPFYKQALAAIPIAQQVGRPLWISRHVLRGYRSALTRSQAFDAVPTETVRLTRFEACFTTFEWKWIKRDEGDPSKHLVWELDPNNTATSAATMVMGAF